MKISYYSIFDVKAAAFLPATAADNDETAIRAFVHAALNPASLFHTHSEDFTLYKTGVFDQITGDWRDTQPSRPIGNLQLLLAQRQAGAADGGGSSETSPRPPQAVGQVSLAQKLQKTFKKDTKSNSHRADV